MGLTDSEKPVVIGAQQNPAASFFKQLWLQCFSGPEMRNNCNEREPSVFLQLATGRKILKKLIQIRFGKKRETKPKLKIWHQLSLSLHNLCNWFISQEGISLSLLKCERARERERGHDYYYSEEYLSLCLLTTTLLPFLIFNQVRKLGELNK